MSHTPGSDAHRVEQALASSISQTAERELAAARVLAALTPTPPTDHLQLALELSARGIDQRIALRVAGEVSRS